MAQEKTILEPVKKWLEDRFLESGSGHAADWNEVFGSPLLQGETGHVTVNHVLMTGVVVVLLAVIALWVRRSYSGSREDVVLPDDGLTWRNFIEFTFDYMLEQMSQLMPREAAKEYLPLIVTLTLFILFSNLLGLVPGFLPPTQNLNTSLALAVGVFFSYNAIGFGHNGLAYLKEFAAPLGITDLVGEDTGVLVWILGAASWLFMNVLFIVIEAVSHAFRPISLAVRLTGNMGGDHQVLAQFGDLVPLGLPIPFLFFGLLVSLIQTLVFALLSVAYISLATEGTH